MYDLLTTPIVFLMAAVLFVPLAQRLGLGSVLGYLIAGCLIGPWGMSLISHVEVISHIAEIGVVLMLFLIGLELQPKKLLAMRKTVFAGGTLQMTTCGMALAGYAAIVGLTPIASVVVGVTLALSSTAIAVQIMQEKKLDHTPAGKAAFAILLFQDMAAIPLLVIVPLLATSGAQGQPEFQWLHALAAIAVVSVVGLYGMQPALRLMAKTGLREIFTAFALLLVLSIAYLMTLAHLSMGLGAFLAGVLLARSEYRKALETDLEPFKGLLLGLFFTSVGMSMNLGLLAEAPVRLFLLAVSYMAIKMALLALIARAIPVSSAQRWQFAGLLAQGSEFAFVVFAVALDANVLSSLWHQTLVLVVGISMALSPLVMILCQTIALRLRRPPTRPADVIEPGDARVIIAGFGRVGQIAGRMLLASGVEITVLDNDPDLIDSVRRFGFKVFYGDATRLDLMRSAGAETASLLINAIDDMDSNLKLIDLVKAHFPKLKIVARARNVTHLFELQSRDIDVIERETFESALMLAQHAMEQLGVGHDTAVLARDKFRSHNVTTLDAIFPFYKDECKSISIDQVAREELARSFEQDRIRM